MFTRDYVPAKDRPEYADKLPDDDSGPLVFKGIVAGACLSVPLWIVLFWGAKALGHAAGVW